MAHMIDMSNDRANFAYTGDAAWHGLGQHVEADASLDQWRIAAGLNFDVKAAATMYNTQKGMKKGDGKILYRNDTGAMLAHVTDRYKILQPSEVVGFYADLVGEYGFRMETMGALSDGKRIFALAKTPENFMLAGGDKIDGYLLLATSYDKSMATRAMFTTVRVVCHNTLSLAVAGKNTGVSVSHKAMFDGQKVKLDLGILGDSMAILQNEFDRMTRQKLSGTDAKRLITEIVFDITTDDLAKNDKLLNTRKANIVENIFGLYNGAGMGSHLASANGTAFGLLNSITEFVDHHQGRGYDTRTDSALFGAGDRLKNKAYEAIKAIAA